MASIAAQLSAADNIPYVTCDQDQVRQKARSKELQDIYKADQDDRKVVPLSAAEQFRDRSRRERVGQIFGEGCINSSADYAAAAMVYQHGDRPDHFFQTFLWAKRAVELGDTSKKRLMALGLDRYLTNTNHKQLFASQANRLLSDPCWCLEPVEKTFPEPLRKEYMGNTLAEQFAWVDSLNKGASCPPAKECNHDFKPSPKATIPGFW
jgi:hypothetical protein